MSMNEILYLGRMDLYQYLRWDTNLSLAVIAAVYLLFRRKRGESLRESALIAIIATVLVALPGVSYLVQHFGNYAIGRDSFEFFPIVLFIAGAGTEVIQRLSKESRRRSVIVVICLLLLIPAGLSVGEKPIRDNIARHKSFTGVTPEAAWMCGELKRVFNSDSVEAVLPQEFQQQVGITDTGISCPQVDYRGADDIVTPYLEAAREYDVHILVLHDDLANANESVLHGNGFNVIQFLSGYQIWTNMEFD